jgi:hypothetical protein
MIRFTKLKHGAVNFSTFYTISENSGAKTTAVLLSTDKGHARRPCGLQTTANTENGIRPKHLMSKQDFDNTGKNGALHAFKYLTVNGW